MFSRSVLRTPFKRVVGQVRSMGGGHHGEVINEIIIIIINCIIINA